jgi:hypothetical protein
MPAVHFDGGGYPKTGFKTNQLAIRKDTVLVEGHSVRLRELTTCCASQPSNSGLPHIVRRPLVTDLRNWRSAVCECLVVGFYFGSSLEARR